jgi:hypothetical protein
MQAQIKDAAAKDAATPDLKRHMTGLITHQKRWQKVAETMPNRHSSNASAADNSSS